MHVERVVHNEFVINAGKFIMVSLVTYWPTVRYYSLLGWVGTYSSRFSYWNDSFRDAFYEKGTLPSR